MRPIALPAARSLAILGVALLFVAAARPDDKDLKTAKLTGTVTNANGQKVGGVNVSLIGAPTPTEGNKGPGRGGKGGKKSADLAALDPTELQKGPILATVTTDAKGAFTFTSLKPGEVSYRAGNPATVGYATGKVTLVADKTVTLEVKLGAPVR